jgi:hypothetical protein
MMKGSDARNTLRSDEGHDVACAVPEDEVIVRLDVGGIVFFYRERLPSAEIRTASDR